MLIMRYQKDDEICEEVVTVETAHNVFLKLKQKYGNVDFIMIENGVEHCLW